MMRRLKLYIEMRDRAKAARMDLEENGGAPVTAYPTQAVIPPNFQVMTSPSEMVYPGPVAPQIPSLQTPTRQQLEGWSCQESAVHSSTLR